jgi:hypothetical protein
MSTLIRPASRRVIRFGREEHLRFAARNALDRPVLVGVVGALLGGAIVAMLSLLSPHGVGALVHAAPPATDASAAPRSLPVLAADRGFDGQYYYRMSVAPLSTADQVAGVRFDLPSLRQQRVGYPALVWIASLADRDRVPAALVAINIAAMFALGWVGGAIARTFGRHPAWGLLFVLFPGFIYSIGFDLSEIVAATFLAGAVLALQRRHVAIAVVLASSAVLTRETTAIFPLALVIAAVWCLRSPDRRSVRTDAARLAVAGVVPLAVLAAWQLWLRWSWHALPLTTSADKNVRFPFQGLIDSIDKFLPPDSGAALFRDVSLGFLVVVVGIGCLALRRSTAPPYMKLGFVLGALLLPLLSAFPWAGATSFMRAATEAYFFAVLVVLGHDYRVSVDGLLVYSSLGVFALTLVSEAGKARA